MGPHSLLLLNSNILEINDLQEDRMVFHCRCFSLRIEEHEDIEYETTTQRNSTSSQTFYTAPSHLSQSISEFQAKPSGFSNLSGKPNNLRVFTVAELKEATNNFDRDRNIGEGGFGRVYWGVIQSLNHPFDQIQVAVKYAKGVMMGHKEWLTEVNVFGVIEHPNLVKLVGYCAQEGMQLFLVYEFMPNRSVEDHLFSSSKTPLSWRMRLKVAQDAARGLAYLHEELDSEIIFRNFKSSNILLDDQWNVKLSGFGADPVVPDGERFDALLSAMVYVAPETIESGHISSKSDVWSYGVFLYELITGRRTFYRHVPVGEQQNLLYWVRPYTYSKKKVRHIIDPRLKGTCPVKSALALVNIAKLCLNNLPSKRPKMSEVLELVDALIGALSQPNSPARPPPVPDFDMNIKKVVTIDEKTRENTTEEGERGSIDVLTTKSASPPQIRDSKSLKSWFRNKSCCVS